MLRVVAPRAAHARGALRAGSLRGAVRGCASVSFDWPKDVSRTLDALHGHLEGEPDKALTSKDYWDHMKKLREEVAQRTRHGLSKHVVNRMLEDRFWAPVVAPLHKDGVTQIKTESLFLLSYAAQAKEVTEKLLAEGIGGRLAELVEGGTRDVQAGASVLIGNMVTMHGKDVADKLCVEGGVLPALVRALRAASDVFVVTGVVSAIGAVATEPSMRAPLVAAGAVEELARVMQAAAARDAGAEDTTRFYSFSAAATALGNLIGERDAETQRRVAASPALALACGEVEAAAAGHAHSDAENAEDAEDRLESAAWLLAAATALNPEVQSEVGARGVVGALTRLLEDPREGVVWHACMALENATHGHRQNTLALLGAGAGVAHKLISITRGEGVGDTTAPLHAAATLIQSGQFLPEAGWSDGDVADVVLTLQELSEQHAQYIEGTAIKEAFKVWARVAQDMGAGPGPA